MIELFRFLQSERALLHSHVLPLSVGAGLSRGLLIMLINAAVISGHSLTILASAAVMVLMFHLACLHFGRMAAHQLIERIQCDLRTKLIHKLLHVDAAFFFGRESGELYNVLSNDISSIANSSVRFLTSLQSIVLIVFCIFYIFWLSPLVGITTIATIVFACAVCIILDRGGRGRLVKAHRGTSAFFNRVQDAIHGFKEIRLNGDRRRELDGHVSRLLDSVRNLSTSAERRFSLSQSTAQAFMFAQLGVIAFLLPIIAGADSSLVFQILAVALFVYGPIDRLLGGYPGMARSRVSLERLQALQQELDRAELEAPAISSSPEPAALRDFKTIALEGVIVNLVDSTAPPEGVTGEDERFVVGPIDLTIRRGEIVFIHGGNGSGKTTLLTALCGLRELENGSIAIDGATVHPHERVAYRSMFSAVFSDFHLFRHLYGFTPSGHGRVAAIMAEMDLPKRVTIADGEFSNLSLSAGQRRRLALSVALAEDRPVLLCDEFAADQDPAHRAFFYEHLLPALRAEGRTVIAITHDESRFHLCDQLIKMDQGRIVAIQRGHLDSQDLARAPILVADSGTEDVIRRIFQGRAGRRASLAGASASEQSVESSPETRGRAADS
jgi:putative ATP-binding cassette transporter